MGKVRIDRYGLLITVPRFLDEGDGEEAEINRIIPSILAIVFGAALLLVIGVLLVVAAEAAVRAQSLDEFKSMFLWNATDPFARDAALSDDVRFTVQRGVAFALALPGVLFLLSKINDRPMRSFVTSARRFRWGLALTGALSFGAILGGAHFIGWSLEPGHYQFPLWQAGEPDWVRLAFVAALLAFTLPQTTFEEVVSRGWGLQTTWAVTRHILPLLAANGLIAALLITPRDPTEALAHLGAAIAWSWAAIRLGGLEFAVGARTMSAIVTGAVIAPPNALTAGLDSTDLWVRLGASAAALIAIEATAHLSRRRRPRPSAADHVPSSSATSASGYS